MSRELDARVAEAMGWTWYETEQEWGWKLPNGNWACENEGTPAYSTDPAACEELRKECRRRGWCYEEAWYVADDGSDPEFWVWLNDFQRHHKSKVSQEEAFCLAFLAAVAAEKGAKQ